MKFIEDECKILWSEALQRLREKTQVFVHPRDHKIPTRMSHTLEVMAFSVSISDSLGLDTNLVRAIALGHDVGHPPFGHMGERILGEVTGRKISHSIMGPLVLEAEGIEVDEKISEGIRCHSGPPDEDHKLIPEYFAVKLADRISFTLTDLDSSIRLGYLKDIPCSVRKLGRSKEERVKKCLYSIIQESRQNKKLSFSNSFVAENFYEIIPWMYKEVYPQFNELIPVNTIKETLSLIKKYFGNYDSAVVFSMMTEGESEMLCLSDSHTIEELTKRFSNLKKGKTY